MLDARSEDLMIDLVSETETPNYHREICRNINSDTSSHLTRPVLGARISISNIRHLNEKDTTNKTERQNSLSPLDWWLRGNDECLKCLQSCLHWNSEIMLTLWAWDSDLSVKSFSGLHQHLIKWEISQWLSSADRPLFRLNTSRLVVTCDLWLQHGEGWRCQELRGNTAINQSDNYKL